jgi:hypothetical protein
MEDFASGRHGSRATNMAPTRMTLAASAYAELGHAIVPSHAPEVEHALEKQSKLATVQVSGLTTIQ